jgi:hypothetical protein
MALDKNANAFLSGSAGKKEADSRSSFDLERRLKDQDKILSANDMGGEYDAKTRQLFTTIDGKPRILTYDDLKRFKDEVKRLEYTLGKNSNRGGIKVKTVIDLSLQEDRERANKQIHTAVPISSKGGVVHFQTNASEESKDTRHHVYVQFMDFDAVVATGKPAKEAVKLLTNAVIRYDCSCGRHTFWYRYIATTGKFNYGRAEDGYPRIRNPKLRGVACKHVLRVMQIINQSPFFKEFLIKMIERGRQQLVGRQKSLTEKQIKEAQDKMRKEYGKKKITTLEERREARKAKPVNDLKAKAAEKAKAKAAEKAKTKAVNENKNEAIMRIKMLMRDGAVSKENGEFMIQTLRNSK